ncbi:hypothetical protein [Peribacillus loiseleuriae]|uniref:Uncharacterized protein n=1 Tax=Peribacillus loiseleuriae TaxID=1679170 RepID=A0A0K9GS95_9BACI|nr:hypothetical protein [Peribacillus loiseleuriae]KMY49559.1 hypothetical protein AC625_08375 [Peribacillus loiseleuriae]
MKITIDSFEELPVELSEQMKIEFEKLIITDLGIGLELNPLEEIIIPKDFGDSVTFFQKKHGLPVGYTNNEMGMAAGKTISYIENGELKIVIFIQNGLFFYLFDEDRKKSQLAINLIHHELCHVHDEFNKSKMKKINDEIEEELNKNALLRILYAHSGIIWDEYIAPRLSARTYLINEESDFFTEYLLDLISDSEKKIIEEIKQYRSHDDINELFNRVQELTNPVMKIGATVFGLIHGLSLQNTEIMTVINEHIDKTFLSYVWDDLGHTLSYMFDQYPNWESSRIFDELNNIVMKVWNELGIYPELYKEDQLYIDVR